MWENHKRTLHEAKKNLKYTDTIVNFLKKIKIYWRTYRKYTSLMIGIEGIIIL